MSVLRELDIEQVKQENPFAKLVNNQTIVEVSELKLESGITIHNFPIAYKTWGKLNSTKDNVLIVCHALTGSADVADWWGPLLGSNLAFDPSRFFVICLNSMGSPYGSFSPLTINAQTGLPWGPEFPLCTVRDDTRAHRIVLDYLGVTSVAAVIGGSMGGMLALEWATTFGKDYIHNLVALATSARHSAWCISWSEAQRQSIYSDPKYCDGYYELDDPPVAGLSAARMAALLTYRSRNSFEKKFSRNTPSLAQRKKSGASINLTNQSRQDSIRTSLTEVDINIKSLKIHNDGIAHPHSPPNNSFSRNNSTSSSSDSLKSVSSHTSITSATATINESKDVRFPKTYFSAQSYLRYQGGKFINRFDANCYIAITRKLDTHDLSRDRFTYSLNSDSESESEQDDENIVKVLQSIEQPSLIIGISSDGLFTYSEQEFLAQHIPNAKLNEIVSPEGHDAFLLEFKLINGLIVDFLHENAKEITNSKPIQWNGETGNDENQTSVFGEAEEVTNW
ncbi:hypothetical protein TBLA_0A05310 [Henningerozyma blattae CBS 6284]|uniref:AB hydrolase-1 domain-containing protein n=1 Tax=Henningerozyma blattae (strain ATCC 34711 / CBS 6284 / DSM 70876 / NBRC 10599 / NRRL Y-10934 / UCD 77-7) TaxID=1071380 RepID=I2GW22_HENB6|nr:hypothetical protein TBLA_0A05310 [Tetrapisispora blattae CBS 6284]CCH58324.1 hypothetical protein TBLA_0A05310 [Tetrapisispora blattae CBS 6284]